MPTKKHGEQKVTAIFDELGFKPLGEKERAQAAAQLGTHKGALFFATTLPKHGAEEAFMRLTLQLAESPPILTYRVSNGLDGELGLKAFGTRGILCCA